MSNIKDEMRENNPLIKAYLRILPVTVIVAAAIYLLVRLISAFTAPDQLMLNVKYADFEQGAVLKEPMRVAFDEAFENELSYVKEKKSGFMDNFVFWDSGEEEEEEANENGTYTFTYEYREIPDTLYVKAPAWWHTTDTEGNMMMPMMVGAETDPVTGQGSFKITNIETAKITTGVFNVTVTVSSTMDAVPSDLKLVMGGYVFEEWDGSSEVVYDEENGFAARTVVFRYNKDAREDISDLFEDATLMVQKYTVRKVYTDSEIQSNMDGLTFITCEE